MQAFQNQACCRFKKYYEEISERFSCKNKINFFGINNQTYFNNNYLLSVTLITEAIDAAAE